MVKKRTIYTTSDGKEFDNEKEAKEHDEKVIRESIKVYKVYYNPDLNEGRGYGFGYKRINDIFVESQHIWEDYAGDGAGMVKKCEEETGVTVCSPEEAQRLMEMQNGMQ